MNQQPSPNTENEVIRNLSRAQGTAQLLAIVGGIGLIVALFMDRTLFFQSYLLGFAIVMMFTLGCLGLTLLQHTVRGTWGFPIIRIVEAGALNLPLMALLFLPILFAIFTHQLYPWANPEEVAHSAALQHKSPYLNPWFFTVRAALYFALWIFLARRLSQWSLEQDQTGDLELARKRMNLGAPGIVFFVLSVTFACVDWYMSLEEAWYSTIYGFLGVVGQALAALSLSTLLLVRFYDQEPYRGIVTLKHFRDVGNLLLTLTILWTYMAFSQYLIIWSGNLPEEITYYLNRTTGGWQFVGFSLMAFQFFTPFLCLLASRTKRTPNLLGLVVALILVMRVVDLFWVLVPSFHRTGVVIHWTDFAAIIGIGGIWFSSFVNQLKRRPLLPYSEPRLQEVVQHG